MQYIAVYEKGGGGGGVAAYTLAYMWGEGRGNGGRAVA